MEGEGELSTVAMYLDIYIGICHPLVVPHVYGMQ